MQHRSKETIAAIKSHEACHFSRVSARLGLYKIETLLTYQKSEPRQIAGHLHPDYLISRYRIKLHCSDHSSFAEMNALLISVPALPRRSSWRSGESVISGRPLKRESVLIVPFPKSVDLHKAISGHGKQIKIFICSYELILDRNS